MNFGLVVSQLAGLIGPTIEVVKSVEAAVPAGTKGAEKLAMVKSALIAAETVVATATPVVASIWPALEAIIAGMVAAFHATGLFQHTPPAAPASPTPTA